MVASLRASIVLPAPGEPTIRTLCPLRRPPPGRDGPAPAPRTSAKSTAWRGSSTGPGASGARDRHVPRKNPTTSARDDAPTTSRPSTSAASSALEVGTTTPRIPARLAAIATESTPGVETSPPRSESSPANTHSSSLAGGTWAMATSTPIATGRSSPGPSFRSVPGERLTTTRRSGHSNPALSTAGLIRSRASWTPAPGRPVSVSDGSPRPTCASTATR